MNAGATMERVYLDLKARVISGSYPPGTRLDPVHLAKSLEASPTPVREALHRLSGERIIDSWHQEGFRQPLLAEAELTDLYQWAGGLLAMALRSPATPPVPPEGLMAGTDGDEYPARLARLFRGVALLSSNRELRYAIGNLVERCHVVRGAEQEVDPGVDTALAAMEADYLAGRWGELRSKIIHFHRKRAALAHRVVAELRPRSQIIE